MSSLADQAAKHIASLVKVGILRWIVCYEGFWETVRFNGTVEGNEHEVAIKVRSQ